MYYKDGKFEKYKGQRSLEALVQFSKRATGPAVVEIRGTDNSDIESFVGTGVGFIFGGGDESHYAAYEKVASSMVVDGTFGIAPGRQETSPFLCKIEAHENDICMGPTDSFDEASIRTFVEMNNHKVVSELTGENFRKLGNIPNKKLVIAPIDPDDQVRNKEVEATSVQLMQTARTATPDVKSRYVFTWINSKNFASFLKQFENQSGALPEYFVLESDTMDHYPDLPAEIDGTSTLEEFLTTITAGKVAKKTSPKPEGGIVGGAKAIWETFKDNLPWSALAIIPFVALIYVVFAMDGGGSEDVPVVEEKDGEDKGKEKKATNGAEKEAGEKKEGSSEDADHSDKETKKDK